MYRQNPGHFLNSYIFKKWDFIHFTRDYINNIIINLYNDNQYAEKVTTAASELIENAYKYSPAESDFNINLSEKNNVLVFQVRNYPVGDAKETYELIKSEIDKIYKISDPKEAFKLKIMESLEDPEGRSRLGLAKIRLETNAKLDVKLSEIGVIVTTATFPIK